jgi:hypothetical protein
MPSINYETIRGLLDSQFSKVESESLDGVVPSIDEELQGHFDAVFQSQTQAYREVLLGCLLARLGEPRFDVHKPYVSHGEDAFNGRTLDERIVNPFLRARRIPSSAGPYLSTFRRSVMFNQATREGLRDKTGYDSLLALIDRIAETRAQAKLHGMLQYVLHRLILLRSESEIPLSRLHRISLEQYGRLIDGLMETASGGRFPVIVVEATFIAIRCAYNLDWTIEVQGINVADRPSGAGGDITVKQGGRVVLAVEITERPVHLSRVISTFQTKIAPQGIEDYLFLIRDAADDEVMRQARQYFSQGHEINFLEMKNWVLVTLATIGARGRSAFNGALLEKLSTRDVPATLKVAWNNQIEQITSV